MNAGSVLGRGSFCVVVALGLAFACGGKEDRPPPIRPPSSGGASGTGGTGGEPFGGVGGAAGASGTDGGAPDPLAPDVTILTPEELLTPSGGAVLTPENAETVRVVCKASRKEAAGAKPVRSSTVKIRVLDAMNMEVHSAAGKPNGNVDEYEAEFQLNEVETGRVAFECTAEDESVPPKPGRDLNRTFLDHGPKIEVVSPLPMSAKPLVGAVGFRFKVTPVPLEDGDPGAGISAVALKVRQKDFAITESPPGSGEYIADINFSDPTVFSPTPTGTVQVNIAATNSRTPEAAVNNFGYGFTIDGAGPIIEITSHGELAVVTGRVTLVFKITDALSGVDRSSIVVTLGTKENAWSDTDGSWLENVGNYSYTFDSETNQESTVHIPVSIRAKDGAGNPSAVDAATRLLYRDDQPPRLDLDPGNVRERKPSAGKVFCSNSFDPLGDAPNDGDTVYDAGRIRALIWDQTNELPGVTRYYFGMADQQTGPEQSYPKLFIQNDASKPLLRDTNGDGKCDTVDNSPAAQVREQELRPVKVGGSAIFGTETNLAPPMQGCEPQAAPPPMQGLCGPGSSMAMTRAIGHSALGRAPAVYGIAVKENPYDCAGSAPDMASLGAVEGRWVCMVARGMDRGKNEGFSRPFRICFDDSRNGSTPCTGARPTCTDGCQPPDPFTPGDTYGLGIIPE